MLKYGQVSRLTWCISLCIAGALVVCAGLGLKTWSTQEPGDQDVAARGASKSIDRATGISKPGDAVTFNRDVAPIVFERCSSCHHPGEAVPFSLMEYADFKKRAKQISELVQRRYMPPWMPAEGFASFAGERRLSDAEIDIIRTWAEQGAIEGKSEDRPPSPRFAKEWKLGEPDLVVSMPEPYVVPAEGGDIYRNFVVPVGLDEGKWIKGVEFRPGGNSVVHHGFVFLDPSGSTAKRKDAAEANVGYSGMDAGTGIVAPSGQVLSWQPGKQAAMSPDGMSWWMPRHSDLVLQMHIRPSGKDEPVQGKVGLYFAEAPPVLEPSNFMLRSVEIDIPAGEKNYSIESSYVLPVELEVTGVLPHAHYLCTKMTAWATLPDNEKQWLLVINDWNFDWQGDYRYAEPIKLPKGSRVSMRYEYDNSEGNPRNPNRPPQRVQYGLNSADEMGEFHLQVVTRDAQDRQLLEADYGRVYAVPDAILAARALLEREPASAERMIRLGVALLAGRKVDEAIAVLDRALKVDPDDAQARYHLGHAYALQNDTWRAIEEWKETVKLDPAHFRAQNNLGYWYLTHNQLTKAEEHLRAAVRANGNDLMSRINLARLLAARRQWSDVQAELAEAAKIEPGNAAVKELQESVAAQSRADND